MSAPKPIAPDDTAALAKMTEAQLQRAIVLAARQLGFLCYHSAYSIGSEPGFPDLTIVGKGRLWMLELKGPKGRVSERQEAWIETLCQAGIDARIIWPADYDAVMAELMQAYEEAA